VTELLTTTEFVEAVTERTKFCAPTCRPPKIKLIINNTNNRAAEKNFILKKGSRLVKPMRKLYKAKDDRAKLVFSPVAPFGAQIPAVAAAVLSGYGSH
jgi:hypothetical protein